MVGTARGLRPPAFQGRPGERGLRPRAPLSAQGVRGLRGVRGPGRRPPRPPCASLAGGRRRGGRACRSLRRLPGRRAGTPLPGLHPPLRAESPAATCRRRGTLLLLSPPGRGVAATAAEICTGGRSGGACAPPSPPGPPRPPTRRARRPGAGPGLRRAPFSGPADSAGGLLHTPWRMPTSGATFQLSGPADAVPRAPAAHPGPASGSSRLARPAYQEGPTRRPHSPAPPRPAAGRRGPSEFGGRARGRPPAPAGQRSTGRNCGAAAVLGDISEATSYQAVR